MKKIKVLEMIDKPFLGGGQKTVLLLAQNLDRAGFEVSVASAGGGPLVDALGKSRIRHFSLDIRKRLNPAVLRSIRRVVEDHGFDVLHTHGGVAGLLGRLAVRRSRVKVVHTLHGLHYLHYRSPLLRRAYIDLERRLSRSTDALVFVCRADRDKAREHRLAPEAKMHVIRNGVDLESLRPSLSASASRAALGLKASGPLVGTVARLHRQKGLTFLVRSAPRILSEFPEAKVVIVGGGPLLRSLEQEADGQGLAKAVLFLGERPNAADFINIFDVFVLPSLWEGLPYVLVEAAFLGRPIVATAVDGNLEVLKERRTGLLVPPADASALAEAVVMLLRDRALARRVAAAARKAVPPLFDLRLMISETQRLYRSLLR